MNSSWLRSNWFFLAIIVAGLFLRLIWVNDMEWKSDEKWMYSNSQDVLKTGKLPAVGMQSGGGIVNPGLSVAVFSAMAYFVHTPTGMATIVQWINVISILCFLLFIIFNVERGQRDVWLWGLALASVSPLAVIFSRKIWAQDVLPIFSFLILLFHANRNKGWGAFLWGFFGALIGQVHMSGFFYAAGLVLFTIIYDYRNKLSFKWGYWLLGSVIGAIGLIPWLAYMSSHPQQNHIGWGHRFEFKFFILWLLDSHGLNIEYSLQKDFRDFVKQPYIGSHATYLMAVVQFALACTVLYTLKRLWGYIKNIMYWKKQKQLLDRLTLNLNSTNFYLLSILLGLGIFLNFSGTFFYVPYLIVAFPFTYIFLAKIFQLHKKIFMGIILAQLILTFSFLLYIHTHDGAKNGDYGVTYHAQVKEQ